MKKNIMFLILATGCVAHFNTEIHATQEAKIYENGKCIGLEGYKPDGNNTTNFFANMGNPTSGFGQHITPKNQENDTQEPRDMSNPHRSYSPTNSENSAHSDPSTTGSHHSSMDLSDHDEDEDKFTDNNFESQKEVIKFIPQTCATNPSRKTVPSQVFNPVFHNEASQKEAVSIPSKHKSTQKAKKRTKNDSAFQKYLEETGLAYLGGQRPERKPEERINLSFLQRRKSKNVKALAAQLWLNKQRRFCKAQNPLQLTITNKNPQPPIVSREKQFELSDKQLLEFYEENLRRCEKEREERIEALKSLREKYGI